MKDESKILSQSLKAFNKAKGSNRETYKKATSQARKACAEAIKKAKEIREEADKQALRTYHEAIGTIVKAHETPSVVKKVPLAFISS
jgi:vacuolar-type H+-ATPase subunit H